MTRLVWFRNDLRITDNKALYYACQNPNVTIIALFIATPKQWQQHCLSPRQAVFIYENLVKLHHALAELGIKLVYHQCEDFDVSLTWLKQFCQDNQIRDIFYNRQYEFNELKRDKQLEKELGSDIAFHGFDDSVLLPPKSILNNDKKMYKVFTPFCRAFIQKLLTTEVSSLPAPKKRTSESIEIDHIPPYFDYPSQSLTEHFSAGENTALFKLRHFCRSKIAHYGKNRDMPSIEGTSGLSPYLAIGVLSPRQCFNRLKAEQPNFLASQHGAYIWLTELIWREFYRHLLVAYPLLCKNKPFIDWTNAIRWDNNERKLSAWQQGMTGYPIVDAGMRQLNATGWMHNRLRMITGSFLVKDLLIDWRLGERYFMSQLIDGDFAANNGGWQWVASTGTDAVPYFRIFNPFTQSKRFDPKGNFIRVWLPELSQVPDLYIHNPHAWAAKENITLNYPLPIVDHDQARKNTLAAYREAKKNHHR